MRFFYTYILKPLLKFYLSFPVGYNYDGFKLKILPGVFHPGFFFSTKFLYSYLNKILLEEKKVLEIGCGSGLLSLLAARKGAKVTAIDKNELAVKNTMLNFEYNFKTTNKAAIIQSDLFSNLSDQSFDIILINPPYFFKPVTAAENLAWNAGNKGEYFEALFSKLFNFVAPTGQVLMVLADNCDIPRIKNIAERNKICFKLVDEKKIKWETNYIFQLQLT